MSTATLSLRSSTKHHVQRGNRGRRLGVALKRLELVRDRDTREPLATDAAPQDVIREEARVIVRNCARRLVLSPPLVMSEAEALEVVGAMAGVLGRNDRQGRIAAV